MRDTNLVNTLREHAEWAQANEWETPITLGDDLAEAADRIEAQAKEIEKLRSQNEQLREAAAMVAKESAELLERRWRSGCRKGRKTKGAAYEHKENHNQRDCL